MRPRPPRMVDDSLFDRANRAGAVDPGFAELLSAAYRERGLPVVGFDVPPPGGTLKTYCPDLSTHLDPEHGMGRLKRSARVYPGPVPALWCFDCRHRFDPVELKAVADGSSRTGAAKAILAVVTPGDKASPATGWVGSADRSRLAGALAARADRLGVGRDSGIYRRALEALELVSTQGEGYRWWDAATLALDSVVQDSVVQDSVVQDSAASDAEDRDGFR